MKSKTKVVTFRLQLHLAKVVARFRVYGNKMKMRSERERDSAQQLFRPLLKYKAQRVSYPRICTSLSYTSTRYVDTSLV